jgi:GNAT superfamily N-acetyltransferase
MTTTTTTTTTTDAGAAPAARLASGGAHRQHCLCPPGRAMPAPSRRLRLCLKDLYHQDVLEMIERESRAFELWEILDPDDADFAAAYELLWSAFGAHGEMEREDAIRRFLREDAFEPSPQGTYIRYFLIAARDRHGRILGVRDGSVLVNPAYAPDLCVVYLSHLFMRPEARGTVLSYWLRTAPLDIAHQFKPPTQAQPPGPQSR